MQSNNLASEILILQNAMEIQIAQEHILFATIEPATVRILSILYHSSLMHESYCCLSYIHINHDSEYFSNIIQLLNESFDSKNSYLVECLTNKDCPIAELPICDGKTCIGKNFVNRILYLHNDHVQNILTFLSFVLYSGCTVSGGTPGNWRRYRPTTCLSYISYECKTQCAD